MQAMRQVQEQWSSWGYSFRLDETPIIDYSSRNCAYFNNNVDPDANVPDRVINDIRGAFGTPRNMVRNIFVDCSDVRGAAAVGGNLTTQYYGPIIESIISQVLNNPPVRSDIGATSGGSPIQAGTGLCLDVDAAGVSNGTNIQQWGCNGTAAQNWQLLPAGGGYMIRSDRSGKCLDVDGGSTAIGANVQQWECVGVGQQILIPEGGALRFQHSNMCLDVEGGSFNSGANIQQWPCNGTLAQQLITLVSRSGSSSPTVGALSHPAPKCRPEIH